MPFAFRLPFIPRLSAHFNSMPMHSHAHYNRAIRMDTSKVSAAQYEVFYCACYETSINICQLCVTDGMFTHCAWEMIRSAWIQLSCSSLKAARLALLSVSFNAINSLNVTSGIRFAHPSRYCLKAIYKNETGYMRKHESLPLVWACTKPFASFRAIHCHVNEWRWCIHIHLQPASTWLCAPYWKAHVHEKYR